MTITDDMQTKPLKPRCRCERDGVIRDMTIEEIAKREGIPIDQAKKEYVESDIDGCADIDLYFATKYKKRKTEKPSGNKDLALHYFIISMISFVLGGFVGTMIFA